MNIGYILLFLFIQTSPYSKKVFSLQFSYIFVVEPYLPVYIIYDRTILDLRGGECVIEGVRIYNGCRLHVCLFRIFVTSIDFVGQKIVLRDDILRHSKHCQQQRRRDACAVIPALAVEQDSLLVVACEQQLKKTFVGFFCAVTEQHFQIQPRSSCFITAVKHRKIKILRSESRIGFFRCFTRSPEIYYRSHPVQFCQQPLILRCGRAQTCGTDQFPFLDTLIVGILISARFTRILHNVS